MTTTTPRISHYTDAEHEGTCSHCGRTGIRWMVHFTDGSAVGANCARRHLGLKIPARSYTWTTGLQIIATMTDGHYTITMWANSDGKARGIAIDGNLQMTGGDLAVRREWAERYLPYAR